MEVVLLAVLMIGIGVGITWERSCGWRLKRFLRDMEKLSLQRLMSESDGG
jgi:hypothetical protein